MFLVKYSILTGMKKVKKKISESWEVLIKFMAMEPDINFNNLKSW